MAWESSGKRKWHTAEEKLSILLDLLKEFIWTIGDLLLHLSSVKKLIAK
jgi:hypothetical protein